ncbi:hypothetical protein [Pantoea ananatis]|uniref:hypothetical protein n=1 Tax=Pantoea ananas TaxID=553 RepID=UPI00235FCFFF|nr:hypothetical protein [Pantoea ananatis]
MKICHIDILLGARLQTSSTGQGRGRAVWLTRHAPAGLASARAMLHQACQGNLYDIHLSAPLSNAYVTGHAGKGKRCLCDESVLTTKGVKEERQHGE